jgi:AraC-like DNA-binding protein
MVHPCVEEKTMDPRVYELMQMLRRQALMRPTVNPHAATGESDNNEEQEISLEEMAFKFDLSESRMRALFKSKFGLPPTQYVIRQKMKEAAKRLRNSYKRVNRIARDLGFESNSYFARAFKKVYSMTPTQYRKLRQQPSEEKEEEETDAPSGR